MEEIDYYLTQLEDALGDFNRRALDPYLSDHDWLKIQIDVSLFGSLSSYVLKSLNDQEKQLCSEKVKKIFKHDLVRTAMMDKHFQKKNGGVLGKTEIIELIGFGLSKYNSKARPYFLSNRSHGLDVAFLHDFLRMYLVDNSITFSFHQLSEDLKKVANHNQTKTRTRISPEEKRFKELLPDLNLNQSWQLIQVKLQELGLEIQKTAIKKYIKKYLPR